MNGVINDMPNQIHDIMPRIAKMMGSQHEYIEESAIDSEFSAMLCVNILTNLWTKEVSPFSSRRTKSQELKDILNDLIWKVDMLGEYKESINNITHMFIRPIRFSAIISILDADRMATSRQQCYNSYLIISGSEDIIKDVKTMIGRDLAIIAHADQKDWYMPV